MHQTQDCSHVVIPTIAEDELLNNGKRLTAANSEWYHVMSATSTTAFTKNT
jgi:hypothetical protein